jgi:hypothetical protein
MAAAAASIAALYVVVDTDLDKIKPRTDPGWREAFALLIEQLTALGGMIVAWLGTFEQSVRNMIGDAAEVAVDVAALWQVLGPDLAKLVPQEAGAFEANARAYINQLILVGGLIVAWLGKLSAEAVTMVKTAAEVAKPVAELFAVLGVDLAKLVPAPPNFGALFAGFLSALGAAAAMLIPALRQIRAVYGGEVLTEAAETAGLLRTIMDVLGLGQAFADLAKPENAIGNNVGALVTKVLDALTKATAVLVPGLTAIQTMWGGALEKVKQIAETMKAVFGGMAEAYKSAVEFATGDALNLGAFAARIAALNAAAGLAIAAAMPTAPTATPGAAGGGDSTSMATVLTTAMRAGFEAGALMLTERIVGAVKESFEGTMIEVTFTGGGARGDTASRVVIGNATAVNLAMAGV